MGFGTILSILGAVVKFIIKYWDVLKNWIKATKAWLKAKIEKKLRNKKNGAIIYADTKEVKNVALALREKAIREGNVHSVDELDETVASVTRLEQEGQKNMIVDIDGNVVGNWESVYDEDQEVRNLKGSHGYTLITQ